MSREYARSFAGPWRAHLDALSLARCAQHAQGASVVRWYVGAGVIGVALWALAGFTTAIYALFGGALLLVALLGRKYVPSPATRGVARADAVARNVERGLLQAVATDLAPGVHVVETAPITAQMLRDTRLLTAAPDCIHASRALTGLLRGSVPFCAAHVQAGHMVQTRRWQPRHEHSIRISARALVTVTDGPRGGWVALTPRETTRFDVFRVPSDAEVVHAGHEAIDAVFACRASSVADARAMLTPELLGRLVTLPQQFPGHRFAFSIVDGTLTCCVPMDTNPFALGNNTARWTEELELFADALRLVHHIVHTVHDQHAASPVRAA